MHWELRADALPIFEKLRKVGIFHETPESVAQHMERVWSDVSGWWFSVEVQSVRMEFCEGYARAPIDSVRILTETFREISSAI
jgi:putative transferase (TIGR04331 family)